MFTLIQTALCRVRHKRTRSGGAPPAFAGTCEYPVVASDRDTAQRSLGGVVGHAQATIVEEPDEAAPVMVQ